MAITDLIRVPADINPNVRSAKQMTMLSLLGNPRDSYDQECRPVTSAVLAALVETRQIGPLRVRGLRPALDSLASILAEIKVRAPDVFAGLGTAGMLCARLVRGSTTSISNHSWGTAVDLTLDGNLDRRGDDMVQEGLARIAPLFNEKGWYWGAGFGTEDAMHFECGDDLIRSWHAEGVFGAPGVIAPREMLSLGDRGPDVRALQAQLNARGASLLVDGDFGRATQAAVMAFQARNGLEVDGVAGPQTLTELGLA